MKINKEQLEAYKKNGGDAPKIVLEGETKSVDGKIKIILTKEVYDRDGEVIDINGMDISNFEHNPVMLDAHNMNGSVQTTVLGKILNVKKEVDEDGKKIISGEPEFAPTPAGMIAKALVDGGFVKTVSVGFGVQDYDYDTNTITKSELYEVSLVSVPANVQAQIRKGLKMDEKSEEEVAKKLDIVIKNYQDIKPKIKEYRDCFMSDEICQVLGITKTGNEMADLKSVYDAIHGIIYNRKTEEVETQPSEEKPQVETPQEPQKEEPKVETFTFTKDEIAELLNNTARQVRESIVNQINQN